MRRIRINQNHIFGADYIPIGMMVLVCSFSWLYAQGAQSNRFIPDSENDLILAGNPTNTIQRQLWDARVSPSKNAKPSVFKDELEAIIQQISKIELKPKPELSPSFELSDIAVTPETQKENGDSDNPLEETVPSNEKDNIESVVSEQTLQHFKELSKEPASLISPLELADTLFLSGCLDEAAICYSEALNRLQKDQAEASKDKAWILLQLGNCLEHKAPEAAAEKYQLVIEEFPYSSWAELAKSKADLITWYLKDQPKIQLQELHSKISK